ncbi:hypothetical protein BVH01_03385 [Pseudomonas sp. PA1(2017)]|uniref:hypothetical protein n=1 Tax=Pseudomonas sp. PA1(2017) TaxID=1932113 RepID=UPI000966CB16|nr:hypothetical protein [Pseudomonas sp. PA1(2017)]OLU20972.1 hypothetical protein BVH01_03385 [Pseudomonas sp. PA1(2017)]
MYAFKRIVASFTLCPALVGVFTFGYFCTLELMARTTSMSVLETVIGTFWFGILSAVTSLVFYGIPAFGLAMFYAYFQLRRCVLHMLIVCLAGGTGALVWGEVLPMETHHVGQLLPGRSDVVADGALCAAETEARQLEPYDRAPANRLSDRAS